LAALTITYRDVRHIVPFMMQAWLYLSPVIYPVSMVPAEWRWVLALNPVTGIIDGFRSALLYRPWDLSTIAISTGVSLLMLVYGLFYFRRMERRFADIA
jgi:lipopolysaccharide transport system permease protein